MADGASLIRPTRRLIVLAGLGVAAPAWACTSVAEVAVRVVEGYALVGASLAGRAVSLLVDTGAQGMLVTPETARDLALPLRGTTRIYGTGGSQEARLVALPGLRLGGAGMPEQVSPVAPLPVSLGVSPALAGLLGASLLSRFDVALDVPAGRMALSLPGSCARPEGVVLPLEVSRAGEPFVPVRVNGQTLLALLDTGSRATLLTVQAARRLGLSMPVSANTAAGVDGARMPLGHVRVRMALGPGAEEDTPASIAPLQLERGDMLLGLDALGRQAVFIGYARGEAVFGRRV